MTNDFFNHDSSQTKHTLARAESLNGQFDAVAAGFDKLPNEAEIKQGRITWGTDSGAADAYVVTLPYAPSAYTEGLEVRFKPGAENTGAATINVNGLGVKAIKRHDGSAVQAGDIVAGAGYVVIYDGTDFRLVSPPQGIIDQAQDWATTTGAEAAAGEGYSAKEHATGDLTASGGSAKAWAVDTASPDGTTTKSAKTWAGIAKDWATTTGAEAAAGEGYSAKEFAQGDMTATGGSAKAWAQDTTSPDGTTTKSAKTWAAEAEASADHAGTAAARFLTPKSSSPSVRDDGSALQHGDLYYDTSQAKLFSYTPNGWVDAAASVNLSRAKFSGDGTTASFTLPIIPESINNTQVYVSGIYQSKWDYTVVGAVLTFAAPPAAGTDNIEVMIVGVNGIGAPSDETVTAAKLAIDDVPAIRSKIHSAFQATASTALTAGQFVVDSGGAVVPVNRQEYATALVAATSTGQTSVGNVAVVPVPGTDDFILFNSYIDNSNAIIVGHYCTVSGDTISLSSFTSFFSLYGVSGSADVVADIAPDGRFVVAASGYSSAYGRETMAWARGLVSNGAVSKVGSTGVDASYRETRSVVYVPSVDRFVITLDPTSGSQGYCIIVSDDTDSGQLQSHNTTGSNNSGVCLVGNDRILITWRNTSDNSARARAAVVNASSLSLGSEVTFRSENTSAPLPVQNPNTEKVLVVYSQNDTTNRDMACITASFDGTSITFSDEKKVHTGTGTGSKIPTYAIWFPFGNQVVVSYRDGDNSYYMTAIPIEFRDESSVRTKVVLHSAAGYASLALTGDRLVFAFSESEAKCGFYRPECFETNYASVTGIALSGAASGQSCVVAPMDSLAPITSALTVGAQYYIDTYGNLTTTATGNVAVGQAVSTNLLHLEKS